MSYDPDVATLIEHYGELPPEDFNGAPLFYETADGALLCAACANHEEEIPTPHVWSSYALPAIECAQCHTQIGEDQC